MTIPTRRSIPLKANSSQLAVGDPAPAVTVDLLDGGQWELADHAGQVVVLVYFATF